MKKRKFFKLGFAPENQIENAVEVDSIDMGDFSYIDDRAYRWDSETGLYQARFRYYITQLGRWLSRDPYMQSKFNTYNLPINLGAPELNLYSYTENQPINRVDVWGLLGTPEILLHCGNLPTMDLITCVCLISAPNDEECISKFSNCLKVTKGITVCSCSCEYEKAKQGYDEQFLSECLKACKTAKSFYEKCKKFLDNFKKIPDAKDFHEAD